MSLTNLKQFSVVLANLGPTVGHEQSGERPCVVVQTNAGLARIPTVIVMPLTSNVARVYAFETLIEPSKQNGLNKPSKTLVGQLKAIDKSRIKAQLGQLETLHRSSVLNGLNFIFDCNQDFT